MLTNMSDRLQLTYFVRNQ